MPDPKAGTTVLKVGGSLLDLPDLRGGLLQLLAEIKSPRLLLFPGGGMTADVVRELDRLHQLGEEASHWLAIQSLSLNARFLSTLLGLPVIDAVTPWMERAILDPYPWAVRDEKRPRHCPHRWSVTSDSLALRFAQTIHADQFLLLKSVGLTEETSWEDAAVQGLVDAYFPELVVRRPTLRIRWINLRARVETIEASR